MFGAGNAENLVTLVVLQRVCKPVGVICADFPHLAGGIVGSSSYVPRKQSPVVCMAWLTECHDAVYGISCRDPHASDGCFVSIEDRVQQVPRKRPYFYGRIAAARDDAPLPTRNAAGIVRDYGFDGLRVRLILGENAAAA